MRPTASSRQQILDRIYTATHTIIPSSYADLPRAYIHRSSRTDVELVQLMVERLREYEAEVVECAPQELPAVIAQQLAASGRHVFVAPAGLPAEWLSAGFEWRIDHDLSMAVIEQAEGVVTASSAGIADSGTIVLLHSALEGRRLLTLLPDWHLIVLHTSQIVETLPEFFDRCQQTLTLATLVSGPSATADIEMTRIKGVHGPRFLQVVLVHDTNPN